MKKSTPETSLRLPIKLGPTSNGEYVPPPPSPELQRVQATAFERCQQNARRLGMSRRDYLRSSCGAATVLLTLNELSGCAGPNGNGASHAAPRQAGPVYRLPREAAVEPAAARRRSRATSSSSMSRPTTWRPTAPGGSPTARPWPASSTSSRRRAAAAELRPVLLPRPLPQGHLPRQRHRPRRPERAVGHPRHQPAASTRPPTTASARQDGGTARLRLHGPVLPRCTSPARSSASGWRPGRDLEDRRLEALPGVGPGRAGLPPRRRGDRPGRLRQGMRAGQAESSPSTRACRCGAGPRSPARRRRPGRARPFPKATLPHLPLGLRPRAASRGPTIPPPARASTPSSAARWRCGHRQERQRLGRARRRLARAHEEADASGPHARQAPQAPRRGPHPLGHRRASGTARRRTRSRPSAPSTSARSCRSGTAIRRSPASQGEDLRPQRGPRLRREPRRSPPRPDERRHLQRPPRVPQRPLAPLRGYGPRTRAELFGLLRRQGGMP